MGGRAEWGHTVMAFSKVLGSIQKAPAALLGFFAFLQLSVGLALLIFSDKDSFNMSSNENINSEMRR